MKELLIYMAIYLLIGFVITFHRWLKSWDRVENICDAILFAIETILFPIVSLHFLNPFYYLNKAINKAIKIKKDGNS